MSNEAPHSHQVVFNPDFYGHIVYGDKTGFLHLMTRDRPTWWPTWYARWKTRWLIKKLIHEHDKGSRSKESVLPHIQRVIGDFNTHLDPNRWGSTQEVAKR